MRPPPRWNRGTEGSSRTQQRPWGTVVPGDGPDVRPPMVRWPERGQQHNRSEQVIGERSNPCRFDVPSVNTPRVDPTPCINVRLGSGVVNALLDTCAFSSLLRPEFTQGFHRSDDNRKLKAANGTILRSLGVTRVPLVIDGVSVFHDSVVLEEIPWEAVIGCDFLKRFSCTVDFDRQVFSCGNCELPLTVETPNESEWDTGLIDVSPEDLNYQIDRLLVVTSTEPPEATVHVEIPADGGTSTKVARADIEDNVFLMGGDGVVAETRHTYNFVHAFPSLAPIPEVGTKEGYEDTPDE
ncbi:hypothetical protein PHET_10040 [Paragonimus heterotremus]|uniref:Uncharacterized protein n=1 Tax=Paragonimus heterotremus TaxID=100268 RepID=A0A8J4SLK4_9TREM|nr:hypothetical protein PHET_10040 [Paragonimus heterotremus]